MTQLGTPSHLLHKSNDTGTSAEAAMAVNTTSLEGVVLQAIHYFGKTGCISDDVTTKLDSLRYNSITPRFSALIRKGFIKLDGTRKGLSGRKQSIMVSRVSDDELISLLDGEKI